MIVAQLIAKFRAYLAYRRNLAILSELSDRDLRDIGLDRCNLQSIAREAANA